MRRIFSEIAANLVFSSFILLLLIYASLRSSDTTLAMRDRVSVTFRCYE